MVQRARTRYVYMRLRLRMRMRMDGHICVLLHVISLAVHQGLETF